MSHHRRTDSTTVAAVRVRRSDPAMRVSDAERDAVVVALRDHAADGRLDTEELERRIDATFAARTVGELDEPLRDLPRRRSRRTEASGFRPHLRAFVAVQVLMVVIWAATGFGYFWPIWPLMGWGIGLLSHAAGSRRHRRLGPAPL